MMLNDKNILRHEMIIKRKNISNKKDKSEIIMNKIMKLDIYQKSNVICLYKSMPNEVNTKLLINKSLMLGKIVLLPRVFNSNLIFLKIDKNSLYEKSKFGVLEPLFDKDKIYKGKIDLVIVPGISFDIDNNRIGYGKGYYDRFLTGLNAYKIGICFKNQVVNRINSSKYDIKMDLVISE